MGIKVLLAAGTAVTINGLPVTLGNDVEVELTDAVNVDQAAEACHLAGLPVNLAHVDESGDAPVAVDYRPTDASRVETPITEETPAPVEVPTATEKFVEATDGK